MKNRHSAGRLEDPSLPMRAAVTRWPVRPVVFRVAAVLLGFGPFVVAEASLRLFDLGRPERLEDPLVGFSALQPLFVRSADGARWEIAPSHYKFFCPDGFDAVKDPREFRIFCLGGSTVQGRPFAIQTSFPTWLELTLKAADPSRRWRVVNCGGVSYASYRLVPIVQEVLKHQPDLIILHTGHNEFLEDRTYAHVKSVPSWVRRPLEQAAQLRTLGILRQASNLLAGRADAPSMEVRTILGPEVDALLDYRGGLEAYHHDEAWQRAVIAHFGFNVRRMVAMAQQAEVPIVLMNPVANLDTPPFKSEHRLGLSAVQRARFNAFWNEARHCYARHDLGQATTSLRQALAIDSEHAGLWFDLGKCNQQLGRLSDARAALLHAKDRDVCPLRILQPMSEIITYVARETDTPVIDLMAWFSGESPDGIPGGNWLVDHVHPSITGHQRIADLVFQAMAECELVHPRAGWEPERDRRFREHLASLDELYFLMGQKRLGNLRMWAHGRGNRVPVRTSSAPAGGAQASRALANQ